jgi:uncharacterized RDD family membrane protein YckC
VVGFLLLKLLGWLGLGVVVYTILVNIKRPKPAVAAVGVAAPGVATAAIAPPMPPPEARANMVADPGAAAGIVGEPPTESAEAIPPALGAVPGTPPPSIPPQASMPPAQPVLLASALPRAGFLIRLGALLLDVVLLAVVTAFVTSLIPRPLRFFHIEPPGMLPLLAIYGAVMWKLKGTTIGGIVCGLKVVRVDNRPIDWATAIVRALGCFLSFVVVGLGFLWVAIDDDKQSWHDKIAGTTVVHVPKGVSLL